MQLPTVLDKVDASHVHVDPFPHILIEGAVDDSLCSRLIEELPSVDDLAAGEPHGSNRHFMRTYKQARGAPYISPLWKDFLKIHTTQAFYDKVMSLLGDHVDEMHAQLCAQKGSVKDFRAGVRHIDSFEQHDVLLDAQVFVQTPVVGKPNSYRIGHVDDPRKLFNAIFYLRLPGDDSVGADLELLKYRGEKKKFHNRERKLIDDRYVEVVKTIPYKANTLIVIPGSFNSLHKVQVRQKTPYPRYYMNLLAAVEEPLFSLEPYWENPIDTVRRVLGV